MGKSTLNSALLLCCLLLFAACGNRTVEEATYNFEMPKREGQAALESATAMPEDKISTDRIWETSYTDWFGQADPTLSSHPQWEHLECRNWISPQEHTEFRLNMGDIPASDIDGTLWGEWPERIFLENNTIMWDGGFANGAIKIGEIQLAGTNLTDMWEINQTDGAVYKLPITETTVLSDEMALDYLKQTEKFQRYLTAAHASEFPPSMVRYVVKLEENYAVSLFFFISPNLTSEELELYDSLVEHIHYKK